MRGISICVLAVVVLVMTVHAAQDDWIIVPGERAGNIRPETTYEELQADFGDGNVWRERLHLGEGDYELGIVIFLNDPLRRIEIFQKDSLNSAIRLRGKESLWHLPNGISLGSTLEELRVLNDVHHPFIMTGFNWDYGGTVLDWGGGNFDIPNQLFSIRLDPDQVSVVTESEFRSVIGDRVFLSSNDVIRKLNPSISYLSVRLVK